MVPSLATAPTAPCMKIFPPPLDKFRSNAPSSVLLKEMLPPAVLPVFKFVIPARETGPEKRIFLLDVLIAWLKDTDPNPNWLKAPSELIVPTAVDVSVPPAGMVIAIGPLFVVVQFAPLTKWAPESAIPEVPLVFRLPLKVVVPLPVV